MLHPVIICARQPSHLSTCSHLRCISVLQVRLLCKWEQMGFSFYLIRLFSKHQLANMCVFTFGLLNTSMCSQSMLPSTLRLVCIPYSVNGLLALTDDNERRTADAARVLQVVEAYCASAWTQLSCRALDSCSSKSQDPDKHMCSTGISPTESKTLLQQFTSPTLISSVHQDTDSKRHSEMILTPAELKSSARTNLSASAFVRGVTKRSGSKNKADLVHVQPASVSRSSPLPLAVHSSAPTESVVQNMSPPPVILPTRSGRRL
ncbi:hypothetical protein PHET_05131 [Paragonimus heterotremus]|uniref:Uncharacterized protein n=1 Tax=Paragonimus heterotremus TaxID=100268 RepID=A0A8J4SPL7_9TREM|nr:hypothetical protein PHET_05131 [Paragonimus heterotremus]